MVDGDRMLPFVRAFHGQLPLWEDDVGEVHSIPRRRGEQGDHLMPLLFCFGHGMFTGGRKIVRSFGRPLWSANLTGWEQSTTSFVFICETNAESPYTQARPCGTKVAGARQRSLFEAVVS